MHEYIKWTFCILAIAAIGYFLRLAGVSADAGKLTQVGCFVAIYVSLSQGD